MIKYQYVISFVQTDPDDWNVEKVKKVVTFREQRTDSQLIRYVRDHYPHVFDINIISRKRLEDPDE